MKKRQILMALGVLYLLVSSTLPINVKAKNQIAQVSGIPCFANPNPSLVIALRANGGSITFDYGIPYSGVAGLYSTHQGLDLGLGRAFDVVAVYDGTVITHLSDPGSGGILSWTLDAPYTNHVVKYFHQDVYSDIWSTINVGDHLSQGQSVGIANGSGSYSDGPHLHLQVEVDGVVVDPKPFLLCGQEISTTVGTAPKPGEGSEAFRYLPVSNGFAPIVLSPTPPAQAVTETHPSQPSQGSPDLMPLVILLGAVFFLSLWMRQPTKNI